jgi:hypothetical protein
MIKGAVPVEPKLKPQRSHGRHEAEASPRLDVAALGLANAALSSQPVPMMARWSPKQFLVALLAVFLTAGFSVAGAQASVMSAEMMTTISDDAMAMHPDADMTMSSDMAGGCKTCPESADDDDSAMQCSTTCIAPVLAVLQDLAVTTSPRVEQPSALATPLLHGQSSRPDPSPPRPRDLI